MQRDFVQPEFPFGQMIQERNPTGANAYFQRVRELVIPNIQRLLEQGRVHGLCIAYTESGSLRHDGRDLPRRMRRHNDRSRRIMGTVIYPPFDDPTCRVDASVAPQAGELVVQKTTSGPLASTMLDQTLRVLNVDTVIVTGVVTDVCVAQTTREFGDRDFDAIVVEDAGAALSDMRHKMALETIARTFGTVASTNQVLKLLEG